MLKSPQQIAALMTPNQRKPPQWFKSMDDLSPEMTAEPDFWGGVVFMTPMWEGAGYARSIAGGLNFFANQKATWTPSDIGMVSLHSADSFTFPLKNDFANITQGDHTFAVRFRTSTSQSKTIFSAGDGVKWIIVQVLQSPKRITAQWDDDASKKSAPIEIAFDSGEWLTAVGRRLGSTYHHDLLSSEGVFLGSNTATVNNNFTIAAGSVGIGEAPWAPGNEFTGEIAWTMAANRYLSDGVVRRMVSSFSMLRPGGF